MLLNKYHVRADVVVAIDLGVLAPSSSSSIVTQTTALFRTASAAVFLFSTLWCVCVDLISSGYQVSAGGDGSYVPTPHTYNPFATYLLAPGPVYHLSRLRSVAFCSYLVVCMVLHEDYLIRSVVGIEGAYSTLGARA